MLERWLRKKTRGSRRLSSSAIVAFIMNLSDAVCTKTSSPSTPIHTMSSRSTSTIFFPFMTGSRRTSRDLMSPASLAIWSSS